MPFQQLMSVLPPASAKEAGIPAPMLELMLQPFSPLIDFYPQDFGLDLNGKRFTWQAVILLPFIDEPRLVRILAPLLKRLTPNEKIRNRRGQELIFGHKDDKTLFHGVQLAQAGFDAGHAGLKQAVRGENWFFGSLEGWQHGGGNREVNSPIEGLPDVEESHAISAMYHEPEHLPHFSTLLPGIMEQAMVINAADMDEASRMKGFGGEPAKRMILQALGKNPDNRPKYKDSVKRQQQAPPPKAAIPVKRGATKVPKPEVTGPTSTQMAAPVSSDTGHWAEQMFDYEEDESEFAGAAPATTAVAPAAPPAPPMGAKVIRVRAAERKSDAKVAKAYQPGRQPGSSARSKPY
jgi:hypothetical protein